MSNALGPNLFTSLSTRSLGWWAVTLTNRRNAIHAELVACAEALAARPGPREEARLEARVESSIAELALVRVFFKIADEELRERNPAGAAAECEIDPALAPRGAAIDRLVFAEEDPFALTNGPAGAAPSLRHYTTDCLVASLLTPSASPTMTLLMRVTGLTPDDVRAEIRRRRFETPRDEMEADR